MSIKISALGSATRPLSGGETVVMNQNGVTVTTPLSVIKTYTGSGGSDVSGLSANWQNTYTTFRTVSSNFAVKNTNNNFTASQTINGTLSANSISLSSCALRLKGLSNGLNFTDHTTIPNNSNFLGFGAGAGALSANHSNFFGNNAGAGATNAYNSIFIGRDAGYVAILANNSNFLGYGAGNGAEYANNSNFLGSGAGAGATNADHSNFLGYSAGSGATNASDSIFIGREAGSGAANASNSIFIGYNAGINALSTQKSVFVGGFVGDGSTTRFSNFIGYGCGSNVTGNYNNIIGYSAQLLPVSLSGCLVIGNEAIATVNNSIALGSTTYPFLTSGTGTNTNSFLVVKLNGVDRKIPIYT